MRELRDNELLSILHSYALFRERGEYRFLIKYHQLTDGFYWLETIRCMSGNLELKFILVGLPEEILEYIDKEISKY